MNHFENGLLEMEIITSLENGLVAFLLNTELPQSSYSQVSVYPRETKAPAQTLVCKHVGNIIHRS